MAAVDAAYAEFVTARWAALFRTAYLLTGQHPDAEDLLQTALVKVYASWRRVSGADSPEAYVPTIVVNTFLSSKRGRRLDLTGHFNASLPAYEADTVDRLDLWELVKTLPPRQRAVIVLRFYEDLSEQQIAVTLGCSAGTVKSQTHDALSALRGRLHDAEQEGLPR